MTWEEEAVEQIPNPVFDALVDAGVNEMGMAALEASFGVYSLYSYVKNGWKAARIIRDLAIGAGAAVWVWSSKEDEKTSRGKYRCGTCGEEGHNRRSCSENEVCSCGNSDPSIEKYKLTDPKTDYSVTVCDVCGN